MKAILPWHPFVPELRAVRDLFLYSRLPTQDEWLGMILWPAVVLTLAYLVLGRLRDEIRDVI